MNDERYPGLNWLSYTIGYTEQLLAILSEPLLIGCASIAVVDFITGGKLLTLPLISYAWAASLAIAVSACFIITWRRALLALTKRAYGVAIGLAALGLILGIVDWGAVDVQSLQEMLGISFRDALAQLGLNIIILTHLRAAVAIAMSIVAAGSNHIQITTATAPKRRIAGMSWLINKVAPVVEEVKNGEPLPLEAPTQERLLEDRITAILKKDPLLSNITIAGQLECSPLLVNRIRRTL